MFSQNKKLQFYIKITVLIASLLTLLVHVSIQFYGANIIFCCKNEVLETAGIFKLATGEFETS